MPRSERKVAGSIEWRHSLGHLIWNSDGSRSWWRNGERGARMQNVTLSSDGWSDETKRARRQMRLSAALDALGAHRVRAAWRDPAPWCTRARVRGGRVRRRRELRQRQQQRSFPQPLSVPPGRLHKVCHARRRASAMCASARPCARRAHTRATVTCARMGMVAEYGGVGPQRRPAADDARARALPSRLPRSNARTL